MILKFGSVIRTDTDNFLVQHRQHGDSRYEVYSLLEAPPEFAPAEYPAPELSKEARAQNLDLPPLNPRIPKLARQMVSGAASDLERARAVERRLRTDYGYSLDLPDREVADPLADFLFVRRKGYCAHFASAMTVLLRTQGIPARLVTGFQSGFYNPITDLWVIRDSDAHAWVEAWMPGHGWTTFDPTPPDYTSPASSVMAKISLYLDAADTFWQEWVVGYDPRHQGTLADRLEEGASRFGFRWFDSLSVTGVNWRGAARTWGARYGIPLLILAVLALVLRFPGRPLFGLWKMRLRVQRVRRGQASVADATMLYQRMLQVVKRHGYQKPAWFTPSEFAASLPDGVLGRAVTEFTFAYNQLRFGGRTEVAMRLSGLLDQLEHHGRK
jgi:hypothetical protein